MKRMIRWGVWSGNGFLLHNGVRLSFQSYDRALKYMGGHANGGEAGLSVRRFEANKDELDTCQSCGSNDTVGTGAGDRYIRNNMECYSCGFEWETPTKP